ncbi:MAG: PHP domain-containing protein [Candidatus Micrarchaeota archaeon]
MIDLHTHTTASDGSFSYDELVTRSRIIGLKAIAITDHDTVANILNIKKTSGIEVVPGIELSVFDRELDYMDVHVLGLYIDPKNKTLNEKLKKLSQERVNQKKATVEKLNELGYKITFDEVKKKATGTVGRPHIAKVLLEKYPNDFCSISDIFIKLLGRGKSAYVERDIGFQLHEAVDLIHSANGLAFLAHPFVYPYDSKKIVNTFKEMGGDGLETFYDYVTNRPEVKITEKENIAMIVRAEHMALDLNMLECGGSDFHGENKGQRLGTFCAPYEMLEMIKHARFSYS